MAELPYFSTRDETLALIERVAEKHALRLVPEIPILEKPELATFDRITPEVVTRLAAYPVLQLEGAFTKHRLRFHQRELGSAAGTFYAAHNVGPRLRWFLPGVHHGELTPGSLVMLDHFRNPESGGFEPPSPELKDAFAAIVATMKEHLVKHTLRKGVTIWIGAQALEQLQQGKVSTAR